MEKSIRQPKQQRSIDKKERIIKAAYELFSENGYHGTVTSDIAKRAGVSTGIVYGYFADKRDILFYVYTRNGDARNGILYVGIKRRFA